MLLKNKINKIVMNLSNSKFVVFFGIIEIVLAVILIYLFYKFIGVYSENKKNYNGNNIYITTEHYTLDKAYYKNYVKQQELTNLLKTKCPSPFNKKASILAYYFIEAGRIYDINPNLLVDVMLVESNCNVYARNESSGAFGLMQIHPQHSVFLYQTDFENILKGADILSECIKMYKNNLKDSLECYGRGVHNSTEYIYANLYKIQNYKRFDFESFFQ
jgi:hypothetical protein